MVSEGHADDIPTTAANKSSLMSSLLNLATTIGVASWSMTRGISILVFC